MVSISPRVEKIWHLNKSDCKRDFLLKNTITLQFSSTRTIFRVYVQLAIWYTNQLGMSSILPCIVFWKRHDLKSLFNVILQDKPIQEEYETVTKILKTQTELLQVGDQEQMVTFTCIKNARTAINSNNFVWHYFFLQQDYHQGRDASRQLIMALLRSLWKFLLLNSKGSSAVTTNFTR